ncbi:CBS domain-containing protein [Streptacidiphilus sp. PAMC 29251]
MRINMGILGLGGKGMRAWVVRAGEEAAQAQEALDQEVVVVGWDEVGDLSGLRTREDVRTAVAETYPDQGSRTVGNWTGQLFRLREEIEVGDLVMLPLRLRRVAIGRVVGPYRYRPDAGDGLRNTRPVQWLVRDLERSAIQQDLLNSIGSVLTVFELVRNNAAVRIAALAETGVDPGPQSTPGAVAILPNTPSLLREAVEQRRAADPLRMTVEDFLAIWNAPGRLSSAVDHIRVDLDRMGLTTRPSFTEGSLKSEITVMAIGEALSARRTSSTAQLADTNTDTDTVTDAVAGRAEADRSPIAYLVSNIPSAILTPRSSLTAVRLTDSLTVAVTKMISSRCSQLPVLDEADHLRGAVSWESVGRARMSTATPSLEDATDSQARVARHDDDLLRWISEIHEHGYVFVQDHDLKVCGIVTTADLTLQFDIRVRPMVLLEEVEQRLRRTVDERFTLDEIRRAARGRRPEEVLSASALNFGNYQHLLGPEEHWNRLGWGADHQLFLAQLDLARQVRNNLMHFSPDPVSVNQLGPVQGLLDLLRSLDPRS